MKPLNRISVSAVLLCVALAFRLQAAHAQVTLSNPTNYSVGSSPGIVIQADINGDGKPDLVTLNTGDQSISVLLGNGDGTFQPAISHPVDGNAHFIATGDFNSDGKLDLAVANAAANTVSILLGNGDGTFQAAAEVNIGSYADFVAVADFNNDGKTDLIVSYSGSNGTPPVPGSIVILLGNGDGTFQTPKPLATVGMPMITSYLATGDFNGDGKLDIAAGESAGPPDCALKGASCLDGNILVFLGNGNGTFQAPVKSPVNFGPVFFTTADVNGDGKADLILGGLEVFNSGPNLPAAQVRLIATVLGNGDGTFGAPVVVATLPGSVPLCRGPAVNGNILAADLNGGGQLDLVTTVTEYTGTCGSPTASSAVWAFLGNRDGTFQAAQEFNLAKQPGWLAVGNFNGKALLGLAVSNPSTNNISVFLNTSVILSLTLAGNGSGTVTSQSGVLNCSKSCSQAFAPGTTVTLAATPDATSEFSGWSGACSGTGSCNVTLNSAASVTATFAAEDFSLAPASTSLSVQSGTPQTDVITIAGVNGPFGGTVQLTCAVTGPAPEPSCALSQASVKPGAGAATSTLTISAPVPAAMRLPLNNQPPSIFLFSIWLFLTLLAVAFLGKWRKEVRPRWALSCFFVITVMTLVACGGGTSQTPQTFTVTVMGTSGAIQHSTQVTVTIP